MVKAYSEDLRIRIINKVKENKESHEQIANNFSIGVATLRRWIYLYKETGSFSHKIPNVTRPRKVDYKKVQKFIEKNSDKTLKEIGIQFRISAFAVYKITQKLNITYKKTLPVRGAKGRFERRISKNIKSNSQRKSHLS